MARSDEMSVMQGVNAMGEATALPLEGEATGEQEEMEAPEAEEARPSKAMNRPTPH